VADRCGAHYGTNNYTRPRRSEPDLAARVRDESDGVLLSEACWAWPKQDPDGWRIDDGRLVITAGRLPAETTDR
jgi:hypothetical protein